MLNLIARAARRVWEDMLPFTVGVVVVALGLCVAVTRAQAVIDIFWWLRR